MPQLVASDKTETTKEENAELWAEYYRTGRSEKARNAIILACLPLVGMVVRALRERFLRGDWRPDYEDLRSEGILGLKEAVDRFDPDRGTKFETYAARRIRGSILDALRNEDRLPRIMRTRGKKYGGALWSLKGTLGRVPTDAELAAKLGVSEKLLADFRTSFAMVINKDVALEMVDEDGSNTERVISLRHHSPSPLGELATRDEVERLLGGLTSKERTILILYHFEDWTMREIGGSLNLSESRVCQIHSKAMKHMRMKALAKQSEPE